MKDITKIFLNMLSRKELIDFEDRLDLPILIGIKNLTKAQKESILDISFLNLGAYYGAMDVSKELSGKEELAANFIKDMVIENSNSVLYMKQCSVKLRYHILEISKMYDSHHPSHPGRLQIYEWSKKDSRFYNASVIFIYKNEDE